MKCPKCGRIQADENTQCSGCKVSFTAIREKSKGGSKGGGGLLFWPILASGCIGTYLLLFNPSAPPKPAIAAEPSMKSVRAKAIDEMRSGPAPIGGDEIVGQLMNNHVKALCIRNMTADGKTAEEIRERC